MSGFMRTLSLLVMIASTQLCVALPPARVHYQGRAVDAQGKPLTTPQTLYLSIWRASSTSDLNSGVRIYSEAAEVSPDADGIFNYWLGQGKVLPWKLASKILKPGEHLYLRKTIGSETNFVGPPTELYPIANAWIARDAAWNQYWLARALAYKGPTPEPGAVPEMRRKVAILYPDGKIQRLDGTIFDASNSVTAGVQELFDYCAKNFVDGYIVGGSHPGGNQVIYKLDAPVHLHPAQGFRLDTGAIDLIFTKKVGAKPGLTIDSCMMVDLRIRGQINYAGKSYAVAFHPTHLLPMDTFVGPTMVDSSFHITTIATPVNCLLFDGSINCCDFSFNEINGGKYGVHLKSGGFSNNKFTCLHIHNQRDVAMLIETGTKNVWEVNVSPDAANPIGIDTSGMDDLWFANVSAAGQPALILEPPAQGNQFFLMGLTGGFKNLATKPTNRFYATPGNVGSDLGLGFSVKTPNIPQSNRPCINRNPFLVAILILKGGSVSGWSLTDVYGATQKIDARLSVGQEIYLDPGEAIALQYANTTPVWRWRAIQ